YYFRVMARNAVTAAAGSTSVASAVDSVKLGAAPAAPTGVTVTPAAGAAAVAWVAPSNDGGSTITGYHVSLSTSPTFASDVVTATVSGAARSYTRAGLIPGVTYYARVRAVNAVGSGAHSATASGTLPQRHALDIVKGAAVAVGEVTVAVLSDGGDSPVLTLGYIPFGAGADFVAIEGVPVGSGAGQFFAPGGARNLAVVADPDGVVFVIGAAGDNPSAVLVRRYDRNGSTWAYTGSSSQALPSTGDPLTQFAAEYVGGTTPTIFLVARRAGTVGAGALSYATIRP